ncbi:MAG: protein kinase, partial [Actinomycetia bacterium]|nr:protein kinase [Actinomycetes bacterium]
MAEAVAPSLSNYEILSQISTGGMGSVYLAEDLKLHRRVAIKALTPEWAADPDRYRRFRWEAQVLAKLNHPNIVTIFAVEEEEGAHFLIMELVEGKTLDELIPSV